jgi:hypothetical protein
MANAHTFELLTVRVRCLSRADRGLLHAKEAEENNEVDAGQLADKPTDTADSEAV